MESSHSGPHPCAQSLPSLLVTPFITPPLPSLQLAPAISFFRQKHLFSSWTPIVLPLYLIQLQYIYEMSSFRHRLGDLADWVDFERSRPRSSFPLGCFRASCFLRVSTTCACYPILAFLLCNSMGTFASVTPVKLKLSNCPITCKDGSKVFRPDSRMWCLAAGARETHDFNGRREV